MRTLEFRPSLTTLGSINSPTPQSPWRDGLKPAHASTESLDLKFNALAA